MEIRSTKRIERPAPLLEALPDDDPAEPTLVLVDETPPPDGQFRPVIVSGAQFAPPAGYAPPTAKGQFQGFMDSGAKSLLELATTALSTQLSDPWKYAILGTWLVLNVTDSGLNLYDKLQLTPEQRAMPKHKNAVALATLDLAAQLSGGAALIGGAAGALNLGDAALNARLTSVAKDAKLVFKTTKQLAKGTAPEEIFWESHLGKNPAYKYTNGVLKGLHKLGDSDAPYLTPYQLITKPELTDVRI
ncbi:MAG: hypothetical protein AAF744_15645 [Pseudomonadota bacterium]